jgi:predicted DNA-binding transcriptional regulator YafY
VSTRRTPASDRQEAIAERLRASGAITIGEIGALFGVSPVTVRRDLAELAQMTAVIAAGIDAGDLALTRAPGVALTMASSSTA